MGGSQLSSLTSISETCMNTLALYLQNDFKSDRASLYDIERLIQKSVDAFFCPGHADAWPYEVGGDVGASYSFSTNGMILSMLLHVTTLIPNSIYASNPKPLCLAEKNKEKLYNKLKYYLEKIDESLPDGFNSPTYGDRDPLSIFWCMQIINTPYCAKEFKSLCESITDKLTGVIDEIKTRGMNGKMHFLHFPEGNANILHEHPLVALRALFCAQNGHKASASSKMPNFCDFFDQRLHAQIAYFDIPDARFDPAELAFSLEGRIRSASSKMLSDEVISRALEIICESQRNNPNLRPVNPLYSTSKGSILLPVSTEVANSLLRTFALIEKDKRSIYIVDKFWKIFPRYYKWLKAQLKTIDIDGESYSGWISEHMGTDKIQLWQTAEAITFLSGYQALLQSRIARMSLEASGLKVTDPQDIEKIRNKNWRQWAEEDPLMELPQESPYRVYSAIERDFLKPHREGVEKKNYSMLIYGPPGTGKTTVALRIAKELGRVLITVTPSDFLAGGAAEVEGRAKAIFQCLQHQYNAVVLFDEIDQFLLDRESDAYKKQTDIFQFMTPGMLPKLQDLRDSESCVFIIATNYAERIDPAIKRIGRIDKRYPLMVPALISRRTSVEDIVRNDCAVEDMSKLKAFSCLVARQLSLHNRSEIYSLSSQICSLFKEYSRDTSVPVEIDSNASLSISSYESRIFNVEKQDDIKTPYRSIPAIEYLLALLIQYQEEETVFSGLPRSINQKYISALKENKDVACSTCLNLLPDVHGEE